MEPIRTSDLACLPALASSRAVFRPIRGLAYGRDIAGPRHEHPPSGRTCHRSDTRMTYHGIRTQTVVNAARAVSPARTPPADNEGGRRPDALDG